MTDDITVSVSRHQTTRNYSGEFTDPPTLNIEPATTPQVIGYWSLEVTEIESVNGRKIYYKMKLCSLRTRGQGRSEFAEDYHSFADYGRLSLKLVPLSIRNAISVATGEVIPSL